MNRRTLSLALCAMFPGVSMAVHNPDDSGLYLSGNTGYYHFNAKRHLESSVYWGASVGYQFNRNWAIEGTHQWIDSEFTKPTRKSVDARHYHLDVYYHLDLGSDWKPYAVAGIGEIKFDENVRRVDGRKDSPALNAGLGIKRIMTPAFSFNAEGRGIRGYDSKDTDYSLGVSLSYLFGATTPVKETPKPVEPAPAPVVEKAAPVEVKRIELKILFDFDKSDVKPKYYENIKEVSDFLAQYPETTAVIEGHTDSVGNDAYNQKLSERRAVAVRDVLIKHYHVNADRLQAVGYGESKPVADNNTAAGRHANRRVISIILSQK